MCIFLYSFDLWIILDGCLHESYKEECIPNTKEIIYFTQHWGGCESLFHAKEMNKAQVRDPLSGIKSPVASQENIFLEYYLESISSF